MKKIVLWILVFCTTIFGLTFAQSEPWFEIMPESTNDPGKIVETIWKTGGKVWDTYKQQTENESLTLGDQFASGVMTWDTLLDYAVYLVKFIGQLALLAGALWIIVFGYMKATEHLKMSWGGWKLWKVVIWILVISFAYVIIKTIWSMFIS